MFYQKWFFFDLYFLQNRFLQSMFIEILTFDQNVDFSQNFSYLMFDFIFLVNYSCKFPYLSKNVFRSHKEMLIFRVYRLLYLETKWSIKYFLYLYDFSKNDTCSAFGVYPLARNIFLIIFWCYFLVKCLSQLIFSVYLVVLKIYVKIIFIKIKILN